LRPIPLAPFEHSEHLRRRPRLEPRKDLEAALREKKVDSYKTCADPGCRIEIGREVEASGSSTP